MEIKCDSVAETLMLEGILFAAGIRVKQWKLSEMQTRMLALIEQMGKAAHDERDRLLLDLITEIANGEAGL